MTLHSLGLQSVVESAEAALREGNLDAVEQLLTPAIDQRPHHAILWFYYGSLCVARGQNALGYQCLLKSMDLDPHPAVWGNAAACLRNMQQIDGCRKLLNIGLEHDPGNPHILANLCGSYVNEGDPLPGIEAGNKVRDHAEVGAAVKFNLALLNLEAGNLAEGFELYATGHHTAREVRAYEPDPPVLTRELHEKLKGTGKRLLVYGEQGLGDELMFATMLREVGRDYEIHFDSHPRLQWLHRHSAFLDCKDGDRIALSPTRKVRDRVLWSHECDAKVAIGNLARFYRTDFDQFPAHAHYTAPAAITAQYREHLTQLAAGRKIIGLATRGGLMQTARMYRMLPMDVIEQLFADPSLMFVSLDYEDMTPLAQWAQAKYGANKFVWQPSILWHWQYEHTAALVAATDAVVTVPQTVAHLSAAMGHPTYLMTPSRPDWRLGLTGETWYWYPSPSTRLLRQQGQSWQPALSRLFELLQAGPTTLKRPDDENPLHPHERKLLEPLSYATMCELGSKANKLGSYKDWFVANGVAHTSIDLNGDCGALVRNLETPGLAAELGQFDVVTNFGTTEHVDDQQACWTNVHALVKVNGYLVSTTPMDWPEHGRWYPTADWVNEFAELNGYTIEQKLLVKDQHQRHMLGVRMRKTADKPFAFPKSPMIERHDGKTGGYRHEDNELKRIA